MPNDLSQYPPRELRLFDVTAGASPASPSRLLAAVGAPTPPEGAAVGREKGAAAAKATVVAAAKAAASAVALTAAAEAPLEIAAAGSESPVRGRVTSVPEVLAAQIEPADAAAVQNLRSPSKFASQVAAAQRVARRSVGTRYFPAATTTATSATTMGAASTVGPSATFAACSGRMSVAAFGLLDACGADAAARERAKELLRRERALARMDFDAKVAAEAAFAEHDAAAAALPRVGRGLTRDVAPPTLEALAAADTVTLPVPLPKGATAVERAEAAVPLLQAELDALTAQDAADAEAAASCPAAVWLQAAQPPVSSLDAVQAATLLRDAVVRRSCRALECTDDAVRDGATLTAIVQGLAPYALEHRTTIAPRAPPKPPAPKPKRGRRGADDEEEEPVVDEEEEEEEEQEDAGGSSEDEDAVRLGPNDEDADASEEEDEDEEDEATLAAREAAKAAARRLAPKVRRSVELVQRPPVQVAALCLARTPLAFVSPTGAAAAAIAEPDAEDPRAVARAQRMADAAAAPAAAKFVPNGATAVEVLAHYLGSFAPDVGPVPVPELAPYDPNKKPDEDGEGDAEADGHDGGDEAEADEDAAAHDHDGEAEEDEEAAGPPSRRRSSAKEADAEAGEDAEEDDAGTAPSTARYASTHNAATDNDLIAPESEIPAIILEQRRLQAEVAAAKKRRAAGAGRVALTRLDLSGNALGAVFPLLAPGLLANGSVSWLSLAMNSLGNPSAATAGLVGGAPASASEASATAEENATLLTQLLRESRFLTHVDLSDNDLTADVVAQLANAIAETALPADAATAGGVEEGEEGDDGEAAQGAEFQPFYVDMDDADADEDREARADMEQLEQDEIEREKAREKAARVAKLRAKAKERERAKAEARRKLLAAQRKKRGEPEDEEGEEGEEEAQAEPEADEPEQPNDADKPNGGEGDEEEEELDEEERAARDAKRKHDAWVATMTATVWRLEQLRKIVAEHERRTAIARECFEAMAAMKVDEFNGRRTALAWASARLGLERARRRDGPSRLESLLLAGNKVQTAGAVALAQMLRHDVPLPRPEAEDEGEAETLDGITPVRRRRRRAPQYDEDGNELEEEGDEEGEEGEEGEDDDGQSPPPGHHETPPPAPPPTRPGIRTITALDVARAHIGAKGAFALATAIRDSCPSLRRLVLAGNPTCRKVVKPTRPADDDDAADEAGDAPAAAVRPKAALDRHYLSPAAGAMGAAAGGVAYVDVSGNGVAPPSLTAFAAGLRSVADAGAGRLESLIADSNPFGDANAPNADGAVAVAALMDALGAGYGATLQTLSLNGCSIGSCVRAAAEVADGLNGAVAGLGQLGTLRALRLDHNQLGPTQVFDADTRRCILLPSCINAIVTALATGGAQLTELSLRGNNLTDACVVALVDGYLATPAAASLERLDLGENPLIGAAGIAALGRVSRTLRALSLCGTACSDAAAVTQALSGLSSLEWLDLGDMLQLSAGDLVAVLRDAVLPLSALRFFALWSRSRRWAAPASPSTPPRRCPEGTEVAEGLLEALAEGTMGDTSRWLDTTSFTALPQLREVDVGLTLAAPTGAKLPWECAAPSSTRAAAAQLVEDIEFQLTQRRWRAAVEATRAM